MRSSDSGGAGAPSQVEVAISTSSQLMDWGNLPAPQPPKITLNGSPLPPPRAAIAFVSGYQVVVLNPSMDMTNPASITANEYVYLPAVGDSWSSTYPIMYSNLVRALLSSGNPSNQVVFVVSFGLDLEAPPPSDAYELLLDRGAGPQLQEWETTATDRGSMSDWVAFPANYILVGSSAFAYSEGAEAFEQGSGQVATTLTATLGNI